MKKIFLLSCFLMFSTVAFSQHFYGLLIDTIGVAPIEFSRYSDKYQIRSVKEVYLLSNEKGKSFDRHYDGDDIIVGDQRGHILDMKEYDYGGNIILDRQYYPMGPWDDEFEYVYEDFPKRKKVLKISDISGTESISVDSFCYNSNNQIDSILYFDFYKKKKRTLYTGKTIFIYDHVGKLKTGYFLYKNVRTNSMDTVEKITITHQNNLKTIEIQGLKYNSKDIYQLELNDRKQIIKLESQYRNEAYEYNNQGFLEKITYYDADGESSEINFFYNSKGLLTHRGEALANKQVNKNITYIYEFY